MRMGCAITSCATVFDGGPCDREGCGQWVDLDKEEVEEKETLWDNLCSKHKVGNSTGFDYNDVVYFKETVLDMVEAAISEIDDSSFGKAKDTLLNIITEMEG